MPPEQRGWLFGQTLPHPPQFELSLFGSMQYGCDAPPSVPASGKHSICVERHVFAHFPPAQTWSPSHALPQVPQFLLSVPVVAQ